jgi:ABC-type lipoprotein release transport system permease subunit
VILHTIAVFAYALALRAFPPAHRAEYADEMITTSTVMLIVGLLACIEPARRALRIEPTEALKEA